MHAHEVQVGPGQAVFGQEAFARGQMLFGHRPGGPSEHLGLGIAARPRAGRLGGFQHEIAGAVAQLALTRRPESLYGLAVGLEHGHVDRIERRPRHEPEHAHGPMGHRAKRPPGQALARELRGEGGARMRLGIDADHDLT